MKYRAITSENFYYKELKNIVIKNVYLQEDELVVNAEEQYATTNNSSNSKLYNYDDIISLRLNNKGDLINARNINKRQSVGNPEDNPFISYQSCLLNNKNYFFINAKDKMKELSNQRIEFRGTNWINNSNLFVHFFIKFDHFFCQNLEYFRTHHLVFCMCKDETHLRVFTGRFFLHQICTSSCPRNIPTSTIGTGISLVIGTVVNT